MLKKRSAQKKIFVLDTSVILYNHNAIRSFEDNDVAIPITVLEELDNFKKGNDTINFEAREFIRIIDKLSAKVTLTNWISPGNAEGGQVQGGDERAERTRCHQGFRREQAGSPDPECSPGDDLREHPGKKVVLVSKDINLRLKAKSLNIHAEDYETGKIKDVEMLYSGKIGHRRD